MSLMDKIKEAIDINKPEAEIKTEPTTDKKRYTGKIIKISSEGYGFISSKEIPFTRIFFHWTSLKPDTKKFQELRSGMQASFEAFEVEDKGWRAIKITIED